jgi:hypothetical protein
MQDNPKGPDWIGLSEALKYIRDAHADVPPFRRMSEEELETGSVVMPRKSTSSLSSGTSSSWSKCSIDTDPTSFAYADIPSISTPTKQKMFGAIRLAFRGSIGKVGQELRPSGSSSPPTSAAPSKRRRTPVSVPDVSKVGDLPSETSTKLVRRASSPGPQELLQLERENKFIPRRLGSPPPSKSFPVQTQAPPGPNKLAPSLPHSPSIECIPDLLATRASLPPLQAQRPFGNANNRTSMVLSSKPSIPAPVSSLTISTLVSNPATSLALPISAETMVSTTISTFESSAFTAKPDTLRSIDNESELGVLKRTADNKTTTAVDPPRRASPPTSSLTEASLAATLAPGARPRNLSGTFSRLFKRSAGPALAPTPSPRSPKSSAFATPSAPVKPSVSVGLVVPSKTPTSATSLSQTTDSPQSDPKPVDALESQTAPERSPSPYRPTVDIDPPAPSAKNSGAPMHIPDIAPEIDPLSVWRAEPVGLVKGPPHLPEFSFSPVPVQQETSQSKTIRVAPTIVQGSPAMQDTGKHAPIRPQKPKTRRSSRSKRIVASVPPLVDFTLPPMAFDGFTEAFDPHLLRNASTRQNVRHKRSGTVKLRTRQGKTSVRKPSTSSRIPPFVKRELPPLPPPPTGPIPAIPSQDVTVVENRPPTPALDLPNPHSPPLPPVLHPQSQKMGKSASRHKALKPSMKTPPQIGVPVDVGLGLGLGLSFDLMEGQTSINVVKE